MSLTAPVAIGNNAIDNGGNGSATFTITTTVAVSAGDGILVGFNLLLNGGTLTSIGDAVNGAYTLVKAANTLNSFTCGVAYVLSSGALASGSTITVQFSANNFAFYAVSAFKEVGGLATLDVSATATQTTATALSDGPTGATAQAVELVIASFGYYLGTLTAQSFTATGGYTALTSAKATGATDQNGVYPEYLITSGTGTQTATGTLGTAPNSSGGAVLAFTAPSSETFPSGYGSPFGHAGQSQMQQLLARFSRRRWTRRTGIWLPQYA